MTTGVAQQRWTGHRGFSYIEVLVATVLIAIALVPAMEALQPGLQGSGLLKTHAESHLALVGKLEEVLAEPFDDLDAAATAAGVHTNSTSYSDAPGPPIQRNVFLWRYDVDNADADGDEFTGGEEDLLWVRVALVDDSQILETLISRQ
ncbi:MAG: type II secretion system protein [Gammaproteobacteria bacterium]|nr:type II secretion system protein [Gammaproteobacteria bacterium]